MTNTVQPTFIAADADEPTPAEEPIERDTAEDNDEPGDDGGALEDAATEDDDLNAEEAEQITRFQDSTDNTADGALEDHSRAFTTVVVVAFDWATRQGFEDPDAANDVWAAATLLRPDLEPAHIPAWRRHEDAIDNALRTLNDQIPEGPEGLVTLDANRDRPGSPTLAGLE